MKAFLQDIRRSTIWWLTESKFAPTLQEQLVQEPHLRAAPNWSVFVGQTNQEALNLAMRSSQQMTEIWEQIDILSNGQIDWEEFDQTVEREIWEAAKSIRVGVQAPHVGSYCYRAPSMCHVRLADGCLLLLRSRVAGCLCPVRCSPHQRKRRGGE